MNHRIQFRLNAAKAIAKRKIQETMIGPGYYIAIAAGLACGYLLLTGFTGSIDASGFDYEASPVYDLLVRILHGAFGAALLENLFAEGPFLLIVIAAYLPVFLFVTVSSIFRSGFEKKVGAVELICYGPADGGTYLFAGLIRDVSATIISILCITLFILASASLHNLVVGPAAFGLLVSLIFISAAVHAYGGLSVAITDSPVGAIVVFASALAFFVFLAMGAFINVNTYAVNASSVLSSVFKWISPLYYLRLGMRGLHGGGGGLFVIHLASSGLLTIVVIACSDIVIRIRGVKP